MNRLWRKDSTMYRDKFIGVKLVTWKFERPQSSGRNSFWFLFGILHKHSRLTHCTWFMSFISHWLIPLSYFQVTKRRVIFQNASAGIVRIMTHHDTDFQMHKLALCLIFQCLIPNCLLLTTQTSLSRMFEAVSN